MESYDLHSDTDFECYGRRKGRKLLAEKRRRARINLYLTEIKQIVCSTQQEHPGYEKMEKAEILESTVDYLRNVRRINTTHQQVKETVQARFQQGFSRCADEILTYIQSVPGLSDNVQHQLRKHLSRRLNHVQQVPVTSSPQPVTSSNERLMHPQSRSHQSAFNPVISNPNTPCGPLGYERLAPAQRQYLYSAVQPPVTFSSPEPMKSLPSLSVCTTPVRDENASFTDSGLGGTPESLKRPSAGSEPTDSSLALKRTFDDSRVRAWVESTWSFSQQFKMAPRDQSVWRPW